MVSNRTSSSFSASISYNCTATQLNNLTIYNNASANCFVLNSDKPKNMFSIVNVQCDAIKNNAGRDFTFVLDKNGSSEFIANQTFIITLAPLPLDDSIDIKIIPNVTLELASIRIPNCQAIANPIYLRFSCDISNESNRSTLENCAHTCKDLEPGSFYNGSLIRLPIPIYDNQSATFQEESITQNYKIGKTSLVIRLLQLNHYILILFMITLDLDNVKNLTYENYSSENQTAIIHFSPPRGNYDLINFTCYAIDPTCNLSIRNITKSISKSTNNTLITISKVVKGVNYRCEALTQKKSFNHTISDSLIFNTRK